MVNVGGSGHVENEAGSSSSSCSCSSCGSGSPGGSGCSGCPGRFEGLFGKSEFEGAGEDAGMVDGCFEMEVGPQVKIIGTPINFRVM